jgi:hypothetical protein
MWAIYQEDGPGFEVSYITPDAATDKACRKSIEAALIASYRRAQGESPTGAFSRMIDGYQMSSYSSKKNRGGQLPDGEYEPYTDSGIPPLDWDASEEPIADDWMGLHWSEERPLREVSSEIPSNDGVYRIWKAAEPTPLHYIGESANLRSRLRTHSKERNSDLRYSYAAPGNIDQKHKRLEAETDLIGAHWLAVEEPPVDQH